ncbi:hypothetical protein Y919_02545 [Caloranaerobacter azorensis H53214]|uniref:Uncharacterized protein n=1 Tax=Caloranaerobacter azorensis H53214 TaxID=1156417 RepID=A0A096BJQ4_9FIRM|nr:hypothetical protein [Caloranaerobacter azorensis]KGG81067.1 hypothetical protein Y919_02545 [Caloranaerobacter azorensis H53214]
MQVTSLDKLKEKAQGQIVEFPGWDEEPFVARVKRVSLLGLVAQGKIPNSLLGAAQKLFIQGVDEKTNIKEVYEVAKAIAKDTLLEPSLDQLEEIGLELTDEQLIAILNYSQQGVKALESFRTKQSDIKNNKSK